MLLQCHLFTMIAVFWCSHRNNLFFVAIGLVLYTKSCTAGYNDQRAVFNNIYQAVNRREIMGASQS